LTEEDSRTGFRNVVYVSNLDEEQVQKRRSFQWQILQ